jgi:hypothetical protein
LSVLENCAGSHAQLPHFKNQSMSDFDQYHSQHPDIYEKFKNFALIEIRNGQRHLSADFIWHQIRHYTHITDGGKYKVSDKFRAFYSRMFINDYPQYEKCFILKKSKANSILKPAYTQLELFP